MLYLKKNLIALISIGILIAFGTIFILVNPSVLIKVALITIAILMLIIGIGFMVSTQQYVGVDKNKLIVQSVILITLAILLIIFRNNYILRVIIGTIFILMGIIDFVYSQDKINHLKKDFWKYIIGFILILSFDIILKIVFVFIGVLLFTLAGYLCYLLIKHRNDKEIKNIFMIIFLNRITRKDDDDIWEL